jgi:hypothetical protein
MYVSKKRQIDAAADCLFNLVADIQDAYDDAIVTGKYNGIGDMASDIKRIEKELMSLESIVGRTKKVFV